MREPSLLLLNSFKFFVLNVQGEGATFHTFIRVSVIIMVVSAVFPEKKFKTSTIQCKEKAIKNLLFCEPCRRPLFGTSGFFRGCLFEGGAYLRGAFNQGNTVF